MAQLMQIHLQRYDAQPWGFRLQGGTDFAAPLVVQKINGGSLAEQAGLLPGDAVIKINDVDVYNLRHKEAQDLVVRSGNNFIVTVQRGGLTWRPSVTPTGQLPSPNTHSPYNQTVTKTSLAHKQQEVHHIGSGYNNSARPFNSVNGNDGQVKSIVNKQYNTPVGIYSDETIAETLSAQAEVLAGGVLGINFKKNEKQYQGDKSEVLKFLQEEETGEHEPEPRSPANFYWTHSHAIGGQRPSRPVTPASSSSKQQQQQHDERIGTPLQQNTLAPSASHRPSLPSHHPESRRRHEEESEEQQQPPPTTTTPSIDPRLIIAPVCPALQSPEYKAELEAAAAAAGIAPRDQKPLTNLPQCAICGVGIVGVFVRIKDKNLHVECFKCATCGTSLKNQGYYNFNNKLYCDIHARLAATQNPPSGTEGYVPVPIKPNTKLSASTISAALNNIGYNGSPTNGTSTPSYAAPTSNATAGQGQGQLQGRADDSINARTGQEGDHFQYVTLTGNVIRSVIPPGKGVSVNYKVNQGFARPYGAPAPAPAPAAAAPKSPTSYPPPSVGNNTNWGQPRPVQQHQQQQPASNAYATLPRSNAGPQDYEQHQYYECAESNQSVEEHRAASYFEEDAEVSESNRESRNSFNWPPPRDDSRDAPTAAPLYIPPPETQHVFPKPVQHKQHEQTHEDQQQQQQWQSRSAPQLTTLRGGGNAPEIESSSDSYTSTCTTTTTTSEEYQRMYAAQMQAYQNQGYDQSGSELDYHMDMEVAAMQQQNDQCYLSSSECLSGRRSAQECVESLAGTLSTYRLVDMVREVTPSPVPTPKGPRHVEFVDEPQVEPDRKPKDPPKKEAPPPKKIEEQPKPPKIVEPPVEQQKPVEEPTIVKETYKVCGEESKSEELVIEDRSEILESQRIFQPTPEIKIEIPPVKPIPPTNIPNPIPKEWISPMVRALTTAPETPVHMVECLCPKPCDFSCQCNPDTIEKEKQDRQGKKEAAARVSEPVPEPPKPAPEPEPVFLRESPPKGTKITKAMTTAPDLKLQFTPNPNNEIPLPEESEPYLPPPIDMTPYEKEDRRPKSPFLKALTTAPDTPYNPFGHDVCSQLLDLPTPTQKLSMVDALITAPDRPYTPLNSEKASQLIEEQRKAQEKKPYQFQVLSNDESCEFSENEQCQTSAFANMTNIASLKPFQPSRDPLPPSTPRNSIVSSQQQSAANAQYESMRVASQRNAISNVSQMSSTCCSSSSKSSVQQQQTKSTSMSTTTSTSTSAIHSKAGLSLSVQEIDEMFEDHKVPYPPPSPLSHLKARASPSGLHKPETIPQYQRNWTVLPTQRPERTPEPPELRENVPLAFIDTPPSSKPSRVSPSGLHRPDTIPEYQKHRPILPTPPELRENVPLAFVETPTPSPVPTMAAEASSSCKGTCSKAQQQLKQQQQQSTNIQQRSSSTSVTQSAASSSATASRTMTRVSEQRQQQEQHQQQQYLKPIPTVPIIVEDRSGPVTMAFQSLDEHQPHDESYPPSRPYTPSLINKPAPIIPFYQTPEKLCFEECPATEGHVFDRRSVSPCPDRAKSPAPGPPPNPLSAIRAPRLRESDLPTASSRTLQAGSITTGQSYLGAQQMQQQQQGQILSHYQTASQSGSQSYVEKPEVVQQRQVGDLTIQKREKESRLDEEKKSQLESKTTSQVGNTQIERRRKVVEEYEHTQKAKTIEIRTGSSSSTTTSTAQSNTDIRGSYGKTGFVANQARRLSGLEQEITNLTSQSQAISARAANLTETTFPQLQSPEPVSKFPTKIVLPSHFEPQPPKYVVPMSPPSKVVGPPPGFKQQQLSTSTQSSISQKQQQQQQQQQTHSAQSSSSLDASSAVSSSCSLINASATNQQQSRASAIPVPAFKPPPAPTHAHPSGGQGMAGRCPVTGKVCSGGGSGAGSNVCRAPCSQSMQSQPSSNNNTYKPAASTGPAGFKPPQTQSQAQSQVPQTQQPPQQKQLNISDSQSSSLAPTSAPGAGPASNINAGAGGKGKAFGATSAPKRGRGILNKAVESGVRVPLCSSCNMQIRGPFITALGRIWCPDHFMCVNANCRRPLQDVGFVEEKGDLYCEYCFEKYLAPTCSKCSGKIKGDCLNAIGRHFHPECFTCAHCGKLFGNTPFFLEEGLAYCEADWNELFTTKCFACGFPVEAGDRWVEALGNNYHSQCFNCTFCKKNLEGQSFYNKGGRPFCKNHAR